MSVDTNYLSRRPGRPVEPLRFLHSSLSPPVPVPMCWNLEANSRLSLQRTLLGRHPVDNDREADTKLGLRREGAESEGLPASMPISSVDYRSRLG
jgi:hypothetical protein